MKLWIFCWLSNCVSKVGPGNTNSALLVQTDVSLQYQKRSCRTRISGQIDRLVYLFLSANQAFMPSELSYLFLAWIHQGTGVSSLVSRTLLEVLVHTDNDSITQLLQIYQLMLTKYSLFFGPLSKLKAKCTELLQIYGVDQIFEIFLLRSSQTDNI